MESDVCQVHRMGKALDLSSLLCRFAIVQEDQADEGEAQRPEVAGDGGHAASGETELEPSGTTCGNA